MLQQAGFDNLGTDCCSPAHLEHFPLDLSMKIDRLFVDRGEGDPEGAAVVSAMLGVSHSPGLVVIAESVETAGQSRRPREIGCGMDQGHHFANLSRAEP